MKKSPRNYDDDEKKEPSNLFYYNPVNVSNVIRHHGCLNNTDGTLSGEKEMKEKNKYFKVCFNKMEIVNLNDANITVRTTFYKTETEEQIETVTIEKKDLEACSSSSNTSITGISDATIAVILVVQVLVLLGAFAAYYFYKRNKDSKGEINVNQTYGLDEYYEDTQIVDTNAYYKEQG